MADSTIEIVRQCERDQLPKADEKDWAERLNSLIGPYSKVSVSRHFQLVVVYYLELLGSNCFH